MDKETIAAEIHFGVSVPEYRERQFSLHLPYLMGDTFGGWVCLKDKNYYFLTYDGTVITKECY